MLKTRYILPLVVLLMLVTAFVGVPQVNRVATTNVTQSQDNKEKVYLLHADSLTYDANLSLNYKVLHGNVVFRKDSMYMYCDSAYFYDMKNSLDAFGNVRMEQGDTLFIYGDVLYYDGEEQLARLRHNVRMINRNVTLYTDSLDYDMVIDLGYYMTGGSIVDEKNELVSIYGEYSPATKMSIFNFDVVLTNEDYVIYSDTLQYHTESKISNLYGPSTIVSDSNTIYTTHGWYDTNKNYAELYDRSQLMGDSKLLIGDTLKYDRNDGIGHAIGNMFMYDSTQLVIMEGQYGFYDEKKDFAFATDMARLIEFSHEDSLYMHADTLMSYTEPDSTRILKAFHGVRFFREDAQGVCDSLIYASNDSLLTMYYDPVMWSGNQQIFGDTIHIFFNDTTINHAHVCNTAFATQLQQDDYYDQLEANIIKAFFEGDEMRRIEAEGNVVAIYYPQEEDSTIIGMFNTDASFLTIHLKNQEMERMILWPSVKGKMYPIEKINPSMLFLPRYVWYGERRPVDKDDIFRYPKVAEPAPQDSTAVDARKKTTHQFNL